MKLFRLISLALLTALNFSATTLFAEDVSKEELRKIHDPTQGFSVKGANPARSKP